MALTFAHTTAGYLGYEVVRSPGPHRPALLLAAVALANGPDLDFLPGLVMGHAGAYHRGVTHTLAAVGAVGAAVALAAGFGGRRRAVVVRAAAWARCSTPRTSCSTTSPSTPSRPTGGGSSGRSPVRTTSLRPRCSTG